MTATMALHALLDDKHRWAWKIVGLCLLLGIAGQLVPSYLLRESPGERRTNLAVAQAELHRKSDLVRAKYVALQEELDVFQTSISDVLKAMAWRKVREEDFNAERVQHIQGVRDYMAERQAKDWKPWCSRPPSRSK
ncbi:hypothetical protein SPRG_02678 [Saprolegnia parasitica CBS 223.65]|uniref:Uncharacterized protein n=1 Tax=Saprolegnia parasitica (strain CBS 223.65) TaxID=695850 RepID=A0A067D1S0_SAPPC|nr:hypothetical protein SPRG_02678 [Saprolegnia parasitica CBS 223.65]KDO32987.1 hypothetical protein SPRG_02678 [Saprolegnia parasitica CBS 223.65]|eukprot:XP_012196631.1 hypothetical protein SPRG_02678 [Saprolegnia parasitica CBS 223.65]